MAAGHIGRGPDLVDENEALGIEVDLPVEPFLALLQNVGAILLDGMASLFLRATPRRTKAMQPRNRDGQANLDQCEAQLFKRDVLAHLPDGEDVRRTLFHPARAHFAALWLGAKSPVSRRRACPRIAVEAATPNRLEAARQLIPPFTAAKSRERRSIERGCAIHAGLLPSAWILNQKSHPKGIPARFKTVQRRSSALAVFRNTTLPILGRAITSVRMSA